jgi:hypothetical protein
MQITAEYNASSGTAYICENDKYYTVTCTIKCFTRIVLAFQEAYGKYNYFPVGDNGIIVVFGGAS